MLTESEIRLLRQSRTEIAERISELVAVRKVFDVGCWMLDV